MDSANVFRRRQQRWIARMELWNKEEEEERKVATAVAAVRRCIFLLLLLSCPAQRRTHEPFGICAMWKSVSIFSLLRFWFSFFCCCFCISSIFLFESRRCRFFFRSSGAFSFCFLFFFCSLFLSLNILTRCIGERLVCSSRWMFFPSINWWILLLLNVICLDVFFSCNTKFV